MKANKQTNDDPDVDPKDIQAAAEEMTDPGVDPAPEESPELARVTQWDEAPSTTGTATPKYGGDMDENQVGEELVQDGVESADRDSRLAATDPDFEP